MVLAQLQPASDIVSQLAGRDIAVILAVGVVFLALGFLVFGFYLIRSSLAQTKMATAIAQQTAVMAKRQRRQDHASQVSVKAIERLIQSIESRAAVADKAYQEISVVRQALDRSDLYTVAQDLRSAAEELLVVAHRLDDRLSLPLPVQPLLEDVVEETVP